MKIILSQSPARPAPGPRPSPGAATHLGARRLELPLDLPPPTFPVPEDGHGPNATRKPGDAAVRGSSPDRARPRGQQRTLGQGGWNLPMIFRHRPFLCPRRARPGRYAHHECPSPSRRFPGLRPSRAQQRRLGGKAAGTCQQPPGQRMFLCPRTGTVRMLCAVIVLLLFCLCPPLTPNPLTAMPSTPATPWLAEHFDPV